MLGWILIYYATDPLYLIASRILSGFAGGGMYCMIPAYISEISDDRVRGTFGSTVVFACNSGLFMAYVFGEYVEYSMIPWLMVPVTLAFLTMFVNVPDSPTFLAKKNLYEVINNLSQLTTANLLQDFISHISNSWNSKRRILSSTSKASKSIRSMRWRVSATTFKSSTSAPMTTVAIMCRSMISVSVVDWKFSHKNFFCGGSRIISRHYGETLLSAQHLKYLNVCVLFVSLYVYVWMCALCVHTRVPPGCVISTCMLRLLMQSCIKSELIHSRF